MEMIINHMNRSLNIIKPRDKGSKGTRRQTVEKSVKAKLSQTSKKPKALTHIWQEIQPHSQYHHGKMYLQWLIHGILNTVLSTSLTISCFSVGFLKVNHDAKHSVYKSYSLLSTVVNLALIYPMTWNNINLPNKKTHKHKRRDKKQRFFHNLLGTMQYQYIKCTCFSLSPPAFPPPLIWFAKERGTDNPSAYWWLSPLT